MDQTCGATYLMFLGLSEGVVQLGRTPASLLAGGPALPYVSGLVYRPLRDEQSICGGPFSNVGEVVQPDHFGVWAPTDRNRSVLGFLFRSGSERWPPIDRNR